MKGDLLFDGKKIPVKGEGYHDHNWGNVPIPYFFEMPIDLAHKNVIPLSRGYSRDKKIPRTELA